MEPFIPYSHRDKPDEYKTQYLIVQLKKYSINWTYRFLTERALIGKDWGTVVWNGNTWVNLNNAEHPEP